MLALVIDPRVQDEVAAEHDDTPGAVLYGVLKGVPDWTVSLVTWS